MIVIQTNKRTVAENKAVVSFHICLCEINFLRALNHIYTRNHNIIIMISGLRSPETLHGV